MKKFYIILALIFLVDMARAQWLPQNSGTIKYFNSIYFTDVNNGYVVAVSGIISKATNGGTDWINQNSGTSVSLYSVYSQPLTQYLSVVIIFLTQASNSYKFSKLLKVEYRG